MILSTRVPAHFRAPRRLAAQVAGTHPRLDVLVNNVGGFWAHRHVTADGLERTFALNHLAPFLLTNLLLDGLTASAPARIVTISSGADARGPHIRPRSGRAIISDAATVARSIKQQKPLPQAATAKVPSP
jgi:NAD(P)-dependent dehydrogenase (short-subunit alcohol dehydrogenase family)